MSDWTKQEIEQTISTMQQKAAQEPSFRQLCSEDINEAFLQISGKEAPKDLKINVVDNSGYDLCIELPPLTSEGELNDEDLEQVSAGRPVWVYQRTKAYQQE